MEPTQEFIDEIDHERLERARQMTPAEKLFAGPDLFDLACEWAKFGIRREHPNASEQEVQQLLDERLKLLDDRDQAA